MDGAAYTSADKYPQKTGQESELRGEDRPDKRACARYRGEVVAEQNIFICGMIVPAVLECVGRSRDPVIKDQNLGYYEFRVESVGEREYQKAYDY